jgi:acyl-CoA thioester hydrolase
MLSKDPLTPSTCSPPPDVPAQPYRFRLRVYWEDTDAGGVVFYANYLKFFERARTEWLRELGFSQERMRLDDGAMFVVADTSVRYRLPARLDDQLDVSVQLLHPGRAGMLIEQKAYRVSDGACLAEGRIRIGCVDAGTFRPCRIPSLILERLTLA